MKLGIVLLALLALVWSWGEPVLSSHSYRQAQTAQMAQIFLEEGWTPLLTKVRFLGRPGFVILEFPIYQTLMAGLTKYTGLSLENVGRFLSLLSALALVMAIGVTVLMVRRRFGYPNEEVFSRDLTTLLIFSTPLIFSMSQWVTVELLNGACGAWALVLFLQLMESPHGLAWWKIVCLFLCVSVSLSIKPHVFFALLPLFVWGLTWSLPGHGFPRMWNSVPWRSILQASLAIVPAAMLAIIWYRHGERVNASVSNPFSVSATAWHLLCGEVRIYQLSVLSRLAMRFCLYVLGPGTLLFLIFNLWNKGFKRSWTTLRGRILPLVVCLFSVILYVSVFTGANYFHNYYQSATVFPLFLGLFIVWPWEKNRAGHLVLSLSVLLNLGVSGYFLTRQDRDWKAALAYLQETVPKGASLPELLLFSNWGASAPVISFYQRRFLKEGSLSSFANENLKNIPWLAVCDDRIDESCDEAVSKSAPPASLKRRFGHLHVYNGES